MKRTSRRSLALTTAALLAPTLACSSPRPIAVEAQAVEASAARGIPRVYRDDEQSWTYHRRDCGRLDDEPVALPLDSAVRHLEACSRCRPGYEPSY